MTQAVHSHAETEIQGERARTAANFNALELKLAHQSATAASEQQVALGLRQEFANAQSSVLQSEAAQQQQASQAVGLLETRETHLRNEATNVVHNAHAEIEQLQRLVQEQQHQLHQPSTTALNEELHSELQFHSLALEEAQSFANSEALVAQQFREQVHYQAINAESAAAAPWLH